MLLRGHCARRRLEQVEEPQWPCLPLAPRSSDDDSCPLLREPATLRAPFLLFLADICSNLEQQLL